MFEDQKLVYHSTLGSRVIKKKKTRPANSAAAAIPLCTTPGQNWRFHPT